ncbi:aminoglycoside phosphotransferase family protein [Paenibacillus sp. LHD-117]|uniref:aminoglycoside phosphotransferase family protein n=1 Tax=Paenibacillus sp. LHD-117 TaxID=3071412 RepID=UPI0027DECB09|nr:aminoglycoside phosphotransferase family protein [Paenibacillus sp. LHD-117]MDQ6422243.1 aminoglycoside phosphotransferase family protein [Paenibacillus sp. LHD-117]
MVEINVALVSRLIAEQFPEWAHLPVKPVELSGWDNRTFCLGPDMSVRLPSAEGYAAQVEKEQQWLPRLARHLPLPIPAPLAKGAPSREYPWHWSVYRWIDGENASIDRIDDLNEFAEQLSRFLNALQMIDTSGGPPPGLHNFYRGGSVSVYDEQTRNAITALRDQIDTEAATAVWETAIQTTWNRPPVWVHGDVHPTNMLVKEGRLSAVIDFGCSAVGDPACDLTIAWTFFAKESRAIFRAGLKLDDHTWSRARGWALWKALITIADPANANPIKIKEARRTINEIFSDV